MLNSKNFKRIIVTNGNPVGLCARPLDLINLAIGRISEYGVLDGARYLLNVPNERLAIVASRAYVTGGMRRPCNTVNARSMVVEPGYRRARHSYVQDDDLDRVHADGREVVGILFVPG